MSLIAGKVRVLIATTNGPVEVQLLTEEDAAIGRCVACIGGTTETADIASAYHAFVVRPTGVIESRFGHSCYRLDVSARIDAGSSWQLGVLAAHALLAAGRLAQENDVADAVLWVTGSVRPVDMTVGGVSHIPEKLANSRERLAQERSAGRSVLLALPAANAADVSASAAKELLALGAEIVTVSHAQVLFDALAMKLPDIASKGSIAAASAVVPQSPHPAKARPRYSLWAAAIVLVLIAAAGALAFTRMPEIRLSASETADAVPESDATPASTTEDPPAAAPVPARAELVPETIPFITNRDRERVRKEYMAAPNYKSLAINMFDIAFVSGLGSQQEADKAAVEACEKAKRRTTRDTSLAEAEHRCELFASGKVLVTQRANVAMPPVPWTSPSVQRPFVAADLPIASEHVRKMAERRYPRFARSKALIVGPTGVFFFSLGQSGPDEAMRRSLERCGSISKAPCLVLAVDDTFVAAVPTLAKAVGFYRQDALFGVPAEERAKVARQLGSSAQGWNAVAVGAAGHAGVKIGATSERSAVDGALEDCASRDRDCRIAVIGPFLVEMTQAGPAQTAPGAGSGPAERTP